MSEDKKLKRLFIEVDIANKYNQWQIDSGIDACMNLSDFEGKTKDFFWKIICNARFEAKLFDYIKEADEIYMHTSIIPIVGGTELGSPELWNGMMKKAMSVGLVGKKIFNANDYKSIYWSNLDRQLLKNAFAKNELFVADGLKWKKINISQLLKDKYAWR